MSGMLRSSTPTSKAAAALGRSPGELECLEAVDGLDRLTPHEPSCWRRIRRLVALSSTTSARWPESVLGRRRGAASRRCLGAAQGELEPEGRCLRRACWSRPIVPSMSSTSWRQIARPSPVPPNARVVDESAWAKALEQPLLVLRRDADPGVGHLEAHAQPVRRLVRACATRTTTSPSDGELHRVGGEVQQHLAEPRRVAEQRGRAPRRDTSTSSSMPLACAVPARTRPTSSTRPGTFEVGLFELELAGLDLREVQDVVDDHEQALGGDLHPGGQFVLVGVEVGVEQQVRQPDDAVHRGADLVAHGRDEFRLGP